MMATTRRRPRRPTARWSWRWLLLAAGLLAVVAIAIGEVAADVVNSSGPAALLQERSYVAAVVPVIDESTAAEAWLTEVRRRPRVLGRQGIDTALGHLLTSCEDVEQQLATLGVPPTSARPARLLAEVFADRTLAARRVAGAVAQALSGSSAVRALASMEQAASEIRRSDLTYRSFVRSIGRKARAHTVALPASSWSGPSSWTKASLERYVTTLSKSPSLATTHDLTILAVGIEPPALRITPTTTTTTSTTSTTTTTTTTSTTTTTTTTTPVGVTTTSAGAGSTTQPAGRSSTTTTTSTSTTTTTLQVPPGNTTSWLAPTSHVQAIVVVANAGDVGQHHVVVSATLAPIRRKKSTARPPERVERTLAYCAAGSSVELSLPRLEVRPGNLYMLTVSVGTVSSPVRSRDSKHVRIAIAG